MKKELLLLTCALFSQVVYCADPGADPDGYRIFIEQRESDRKDYVHIQEHDENIAVFPVEVLNQSGVIKNLLEDCSGRDTLKSAITMLTREDEALWVEDDGGEEVITDTKTAILDAAKIKLLINGLCNNEREDDAQDFVTGLEKDDLVWLAHKADFWSMNTILSACEDRLTKEIYILKKDDLKNMCLEQHIIEQAALKDNLNWKLFYRTADQLVYEVFSFQSEKEEAVNDEGDELEFIFRHLLEGEEVFVEVTVFGQDDKFDIQTNRRLVVCDQKTGSAENVFACQAEEGLRYGFASQDEKQLYITTNQRVVVCDQGVGSSEDIFTCQAGEKIPKGVSSQDGKQLCITTNQRVVLYDLEKENAKEIFIAQNEEQLFSPTLSQGGRQLYITTNRRVAVYDLKTASAKEIFIAQNEEWLLVVTLNQDGRQLYITTNRRVAVYDLKTASAKDIYNCQAEDVFVHLLGTVQGGKKLCMRTNKKVVLYDQEKESAKDIYTCQAGENIWKVAATQNGNQIYIGNEQRVVVCDLKQDSKNDIYTFQDNECLKELIVSQDGKQLYIRTRRRVMVYDQAEDRAKDLYTSQDGERIDALIVRQDGKQLCIATSKRIVCLPLFQHQLAELDLEQIKLLLKASKSWKKEQAYELQYDELFVYESFPEELKREGCLFASKRAETEAEELFLMEG